MFEVRKETGTVVVLLVVRGRSTAGKDKRVDVSRRSGVVEEV